MRNAGLLALALLAACADLPDVDPDECGNLVIDAEEDCDGFADLGENTVCGEPDSENECFFVCDDAGAECPDGWGCGGDGRCRRASGGFAEAPGSPWRFAVTDFEIGDVDGDGNEDLIGDDVTSLTVRFGSDDGQFATDLDVVIPQAQGPVTVGNFDDDALVDVVVPMGGGLFVALGSEERDLTPVAYAPFSLGDVGDNGVGAISLESAGGDLNTEIVIMVGNTMQFLNSTQPFTVMPATFDVTKLAGRTTTADVNNDGTRSEMALAFAGDDQVFLYTSSGIQVGESNTLQVVPYSTPALNLPAGYRVQFGALFADVDGQNGVDLLVSMRHMTTMDSAIGLALNNGAGVLAGPAVVNLFGDNDPPWPLAAADLNGDGTSDYVVPSAVVIADLGDPTPGMPSALTPTTFAIGTEWGEAAVGDFNGDGAPDVSVVIESTDGVDFLFGVTDPDTDLPVGLFNPFHVDTEEPPRSLRVGDYDGDFIHDVAFVESGFFVQPDGVSVIFGDTSGGPSLPFEMGTLGFVDVIEPMSMVVSADTLDVTTDLFVLSSAFPDRDDKAVAILFGSSSRRMLSPFVLAPPVSVENPNPEPDTPRRALIGQFDDPEDGFLDIVAVSRLATDGQAGGADPNGAETHLWRVAGEDGAGGLDPADSGFVTLPDATEFHTSCSVWASGDLDADGVDEVVAIDHSVGRDFSCFGFGASPAGRLLVGTADIDDDAESPFINDIGELNGSLRAVRDVYLRDLDGDGDLDLLAVFSGEVRGDNSDDPDGAGVGVIWNEGGLDSGAMQIVDLGTRVFDADSVVVDDTGVPALLILANRDVFMATFDAESGEFSEPVSLVRQNGDGRMSVGDVNADGVEDFAYTVGSEVHVFLGVPAQPRGGGTVDVVTPEGGE
jgi:hypothetical protein